jgi:hypothetical protein
MGTFPKGTHLPLALKRNMYVPFTSWWVCAIFYYSYAKNIEAKLHPGCVGLWREFIVPRAGTLRENPDGPS